MVSNRDMQSIIGIILLIGTLISAAMVAIGGALFLIAHGSDPIGADLFKFDPEYITNAEVWHFALSLTPLGIIQLGLLLLVATQIVRVGLLCWYYARLRDYWFTGFSTFIFLVLVYCLFGNRT